MAVLRMHVAVDQIARLIAVEQRQEGLKAAVGKVLRVAEAAGRGVRKHDIDVYWFRPPEYRGLPPRPTIRRPPTVTSLSSMHSQPSGGRNS